MPIFRKKAKVRTFAEHQDVSALLEIFNESAQYMKTDSERFLLETESILKQWNKHCQVLRYKYLVLEEAVNGLPANLEDPRFAHLSTRKIRARISDLDGQVKYLRKEFHKYYTELLKTCLEKLKKDRKMVKAKIESKHLFKRDREIFLDQVGRLKWKAKDLKTRLKEGGWLEPFHWFWSSFALLLDKVKMMQRMIFRETPESQVEKYLGVRVDRMGVVSQVLKDDLWTPTYF